MPLVSATDVPIQPYPTGRTSPQAPDAYQRIQTSPSMFGSLQAEALEKAGAQGEKLAGEIAKIGAYQQHYLNQAEVDELRTQHDDAVHKAKYGDPSAGIDLATGKPLVPGFANMHGKEAVDYIQSGAPSKDFNDTLQRIAASASSDRVRQLFLHQARATRAAFDNSIGEHWNRELGAQQVAAQKAGDISTSRDALAEWNDDAALAVAINKKIDYYTRGQTDPLVRGAMYYKAVGEGVEHAVNGAMMAGNLPRAMQLLEAYKPHMDADQAQKVWQRIEPEYNKAVARGMQPGATGGAGFRAPAGPPIEGATPEEQRLLNEVRFRESSNRYDLVHPPGADGVSAGGAYGFRPETWKEATTATGIGTEYPTADKAPAKVQDANALWLYRNRGTRPWAASGPYEEPGLEADFAKRSGLFGTPEQAAKNLTNVAAPSGASFTVHKLAAPQIQGFINELEGLGYKINPTTSGAYNNRNKVGVGGPVEKSEHAYGTAFDINWDRNKQADQLITDLPANISQIAAKWGLKWGGDFRGKKDAMHFEVARLLPGTPTPPSSTAAAPPRAPGMIEPPNIAPPRG